MWRAVPVVYCRRCRYVEATVVGRKTKARACPFGCGAMQRMTERGGILTRVSWRG